MSGLRSFPTLMRRRMRVTSSSRSGRASARTSCDERDGTGSMPSCAARRHGIYVRWRDRARRDRLNRRTRLRAAISALARTARQIELRTMASVEGLVRDLRCHGIG